MSQPMAPCPSLPVWRVWDRRHLEFCCGLFGQLPLPVHLPAFGHTGKAILWKPRAQLISEGLSAGWVREWPFQMWVTCCCSCLLSTTTHTHPVPRPSLSGKAGVLVARPPVWAEVGAGLWGLQASTSKNRECCLRGAAVGRPCPQTAPSNPVGRSRDRPGQLWGRSSPRGAFQQSISWHPRGCRVTGGEIGSRVLMLARSGTADPRECA